MNGYANVSTTVTLIPLPPCPACDYLFDIEQVSVETFGNVHRAVLECPVCGERQRMTWQRLNPNLPRRRSYIKRVHGA